MLKLKREELRAGSSRLHFGRKKQKTKALFVGIEHLRWNSWRKWGKVSSILIFFLFLRWNLRCIYNGPQQPVYPVKQTTGRGHPTLNLLSSGHVFQSKCSVIGHFFLFFPINQQNYLFPQKPLAFSLQQTSQFKQKMIYFFINQRCSNLTSINMNLHKICIPMTWVLKRWFA